MKKRILALILALSTVFSAAFFSGCEFSLNFGSNSDSYEDGDTDGGCAEHIDEDDDGVCEVCQSSVMRSIDIFAINDLHGKVLDGDNHIGVDELTTYFKQAKAQNPDTIFISSGDMWQGAAASNLTRGRLVNDWMNEVGFASMTLGNHEYDWGEEDISANAKAANFPFLAINVYDNSTNKRVDYCEASVLYETDGGAKIGIIGAMGDCYSSISSDKVNGVNFKTGSALTALVKAEAQKLRGEGADFIVYSIHDGYESGGTSNPAYDEALSDGYVDIVFEAHTHQTYAKTDDKGIWHIQGGGDNKGISRAQISLNIANETHSITSARTVQSSAYASREKDPIIAQLSQKYSAEIQKAESIVGYTDSYRSSRVICQKVADLYLELGEETWGGEYDVILGGGFLSTRSPYDLEKGRVSYGDLLNILPFDNQIVLCSISGSKLLSQFINNTNSRYYITLASGFSSASVSTSKTYYIVVDTYTALYSYNGCTIVKTYDQTTFARDLLADYLGTNAWGVDPNPTPTPTPTPDEEYTTVAEILQIGAGLGYNGETTEEYTVKGEIIEAPESNGTTTIRDQFLDELYVYKIFDEYGTTAFSKLPYRPQVGDTVVLQGVIKNYKGTTIELFEAKLLQVIIGGENNNPNGNDPYENVSKTSFYTDYQPAQSWEDAYYRSLHGLMSGELETPDQAPIISAYQPTHNGMFVKNTNFWFEDNGKTYVVVDAKGQEAFRIYKDGAYITLEEVAAYVYAFGTYPKNYTTSKDTSPSDSVWGEYLRLNHTKFSGDTDSYPYEPELPNISGCGGSLQYYEMDIGTTGTDCDPQYSSKLYNDGYSITRGAARIVYGKKDLNKNGVYDVGEIYVFYTYNHYNDFQEYLNYENGWGEIFGNITGGGTISSKTNYAPTKYIEVYWGSL